MNEFFRVFSGLGGATMGGKSIALSLLLSFGLSQVVSVVYVWTFRGMSYTRSFVHAVSLGSIVAAMLMLAINNSIAAGLGIAGSLAIIRFRTAMRDPRDILFIFASLGAGIASGLQAYLVAMLGTGLFCLVVIMLNLTEFGSQRRFDGLLRFQVPAQADGQAIALVLRRHTRSFALVTLREGASGELMEHAYQVELPRSENRNLLVQDLRLFPGLGEISLMLQEPTVEL
jgi:hypothetical protein